MSKTSLFTSMQELIPAQAETSAVSPIFTSADVGCYADCSRGHYIGCVVIDLACEHGFLPDGDNLRDMFDSWMEENHEGYTWPTAWEEYLTDREDYCELWDMAENFLNTLCADEVYFGSSEQCDWGLWEVETEEDCV